MPSRSARSTATATPELNINRLTVKNTDASGMLINANTSAVTNFTRFDKVAFSSGTGTQLLQIYAPTLYLSSNGCTFDGSTTYAVKLASTVASGTGPRALFGNATCANNDATTGLCATSEKKDNANSDADGIADSPDLSTRTKGAPSCSSSAPPSRTPPGRWWGSRRQGSTGTTSLTTRPT